MANDVEFRIGGNVDQLNASLRTAESKVKESSDRIEDSVSGIGGALQKVQGAFLALGSVFAAGAGISAFIGKVTEVQREFDVLGASLETVTGSSAAAEKEMAWIKTFAATTPYELAEVTEAFVKMKALGLEATEPALKSYGNTASAMGKSLMQMMEAVADATTGEFERLKEFGIKAKQEGDRVSLTFQGVTKNIGNNAAEISKYLEDIGNNQFGGAMERRAATLDGALSNLGDTWNELFRTISAAGVGNAIEQSVRIATSAIEKLITGIKNLASYWQTTEQQQVDQLVASRQMWEKRLAARGSDPTYAAEARSRIAAINEEIAALQRKFEVRALAERKQADAADAAAAATPGTTPAVKGKGKGKAGKDGTAEARRQRLAEINEELAAEQAAAQQQRQIAEELSQHRLRLGQADLAGERERLRVRREMGEINETQELQALAVLQEQEYQLELAALQEKLKLYDMDALARQKTMDQIALMEQQHALAAQKINNDVLISQKKSAEQMLAPITSALDKSITGMIMGTTTLRKAMANIFQSILGEFVSMCAKMVAQWAAAQLAKTALARSGSIMRTALEKMGLLETVAAQGAASGATAGIKAAEATAVVGANAAEGASGAAASQAAIPIVGPILAAAAFAGTMALIMGAMGSIKSARGGYDIPAGVNPVTQLHENEMVLPAHIAQPLRDSLAGGGGGGGAGTIHIHSTGGDFIHKNDLAKMLRQMNRSFVMVK